MITIENIKHVLFSTEPEQRALIQALGRQNNDIDRALNSLFFQVDERRLQKILAPFLRARAIKHVRESTLEKFTSFRQQYIDNQGDKGFELYLTSQGQNATYGADEEAVALADLFNVSLQVTITKPLFEYISHDLGAAQPIFHLYNIPNQHWYIYTDEPSGTLGDGNCLYNSFAQILRNHLLESQYQPDPDDLTDGFLNHMNTYRNQDRLRATFDGLPRLSLQELADKLLDLSKNDTSDHLCALKMAVEDEASASCQQILPFYDNEDESQVIQKLALSKAYRRLLTTIDTMNQYGRRLNTAGETQKGKTLIELSKKLQLKAEKYKLSGLNSENFPAFKQQFSTLLHSEDATLSQYRLALNTIFANILLALTGIGLLLIAGKLIHSQFTEGRALFFYQKDKTTSENKVLCVERELTEMGNKCNPQSTSP